MTKRSAAGIKKKIKNSNWANWPSWHGQMVSDSWMLCLASPGVWNEICLTGCTDSALESKRSTWKLYNNRGTTEDGLGKWEACKDLIQGDGMIPPQRFSASSRFPSLHLPNLSLSTQLRHACSKMPSPFLSPNLPSRTWFNCFPVYSQSILFMSLY